MTKTIAVIASLDTKEAEVAFVKEKVERLSCRALVIDVGVWRGSTLIADVSRETVALAAGVTWQGIVDRSKPDRIATMARGMAALLPELYARGEFDAVLSFGGVQNTTIGVAGMKALPIGVPKLMVSTVASGQRTFEPLVGSKDVVLMPSVADVVGTNVLTRTILENAVAAIVGMAEHGAGALHAGRNLIIGATQMGVTAGVVQAARRLEKAGYEVISFHATGSGGPAMEELIVGGVIKAVLDLTLHEIVAEVIGGGFSVGAVNRLEAACRAGIPQVVAPGGADFIDFGARELPADIARRKHVLHNADLAHIKLRKDEIARVGSLIVERLNRNSAPVTVLIPLNGFRQAASAGEPLWDPEVDNVLVEILRTGLKPTIKVVEIDANINDASFSEAAATAMCELLAPR
jgi:uncharacterized protein (UPF0261 family)